MSLNKFFGTAFIALIVSGCGGGGAANTPVNPGTQPTDTTPPTTTPPTSSEAGSKAPTEEEQQAISTLPPDLVIPTTPVTPPAGTTPGASTLVFQNGFEGDTRVFQRSNSTQHFDIRGSDQNGKPSDWVANLMGTTFGGGQIYAQTGTPAQRAPTIVADPDTSKENNKVMAFTITESHITMPGTGERKARIQYEINNTSARPSGGYVKQWYSKMDQYWSPNFSVLENAKRNNLDTNDIGWFVMQEFWNPSSNASGVRVDPITRTNVSVYKKNGKLHFGATGRKPENVYPPTWSATKDSWSIPLGKWFTQEIYVKEGDENTGRFYLAVAVDNVKTVIVDKKGITTTTGSGYFPDGMEAFTLMKVYTEGKVLDWFKEANKPLIVYFDNVKVCTNTTPESQPNACN
jgi:hypothetical protein